MRGRCKRDPILCLRIRREEARGAGSGGKRRGVSGSGLGLGLGLGTQVCPINLVDTFGKVGRCLGVVAELFCERGRGRSRRSSLQGPQILI